MLQMTLLFASLLFSFQASSWTLPKGKLDGTDFDSKSIAGKTLLAFYVSPSKKNLNNEASEAIKAEKFPDEKFSSVGIVDLKSSWLPNGLIVRAIKKKQKKYPRTLYLKDRNKFFPKTLNFLPKGSDVFVWSKTGKLIYKHLGKLSKTETAKLISVLKQDMAK